MLTAIAHIDWNRFIFRRVCFVDRPNDYAINGSICVARGFSPFVYQNNLYGTTTWIDTELFGWANVFVWLLSF